MTREHSTDPDEYDGGYGDDEDLSDVDDERERLNAIIEMEFEGKDEELFVFDDTGELVPVDPSIVWELFYEATEDVDHAIMEHAAEFIAQPQPSDGESDTRAPIRVGQPMCVACGWSIFECQLPHDEEELNVIRHHEEGNHRECDPDACADAEF